MCSRQPATLATLHHPSAVPTATPRRTVSCAPHSNPLPHEYNLRPLCVRPLCVRPLCVRPLCVRPFCITLSLFARLHRGGLLHVLPGVDCSLLHPDRQTYALHNRHALDTDAWQSPTRACSAPSAATRLAAMSSWRTRKRMYRGFGPGLVIRGLSACPPLHPAGRSIPPRARYTSGLRDLIAEGGSRVVAVGECGLDYARAEFCPPDVQRYGKRHRIPA